jgi:ADP-heptose:LPS heptosyltransferase
VINLPGNKSKILIKISCPALGDTLCATPTVRKVALSYGHKIDIMCHRTDLFERSPYVDKLMKHTLEDPEGYEEIYETYNHVLMTNRNMNPGDIRDNKVQFKLSNFEARQFHAVGLGISLYGDELESDYFPEKQTKDSLKIDKNCIVIHPTENWPNRTWPIEYWQRLVDLIKEHTNLKIVMIGKAHREHTNSAEGHIVKGLVNLNGIDYNYGDDTPGGQEDASVLRPISELYHVLNNAWGLISFDAGPIHLAGCTDTHIFQIGASIRPEKTAPYRHGNQDYKFHFVGGDCKVFCGSDPKYSVKHWKTINALPFYPSCLEGYSEFKCQPGPDAMFNKIMEIRNG